jgi:hypothetical protein
MNEPATDVPHVDLAEPRRRIVPVVERPDRNFTPYRRIKADPPALTAGRGNFGFDQQAINRGCADAEHQCSIGLVELEPAMPLQRRQQRRNHYLKPLAADPIRGLPQRHQRIPDRGAIGRPSLPPDLRRNCDMAGKRPNRVLAMPAGHRAKLVEYAPLICPPC